jgi:hypothetical protein
MKGLFNKFHQRVWLQYENVGNTFTNSKGCECSEIDYFIPNPKGKIKWGKTDKLLFAPSS